MKKKKQGTIGLKDKFGYMMGDVGCNMVLTLCNSYLLIFYTKAMGVSAAVVGTVMMLAKFVDAVTDMAMGRINDTWCDKRGDRFRPWIAYGSIPLVFFSCSMYAFFLAEAAYAVKVIWLVVTYIIFGSICYTMVNIPYGAMSNVITPDANERTSLSTWRMVGSTLGGLILGITIPLVIYIKDANGNTVVDGARFFAVAVGLGVLALIALYLCYFLSKERVKGVLVKKEEGTGMADTLKVMKGMLSDRAMVLVFLSGIMLTAAINIFNLYNQYMFLDYFGDTSLSGIAALCLALGMFLAAPFVGPVSKKVGKKETSIVGMGIAVAAYAVIFVIRPTEPGLYLVCGLIAFFGLGLFSMVQFSLINDCVDGHFVKTGEQIAGTAYGMNTFVQKLSGALCTGIGGWGLTLIGYDELAVVQTDAVRESIFTLNTGVMTTCLTLALICLILLPMGKKKAAEIAEQMAKYRSAASDSAE